MLSDHLQITRTPFRTINAEIIQAKARLSYRELVEFQPKYGKSRKELKYTA